MKTNNHDEWTKFQLELIEREMKAAKIEGRLYCWIVMPVGLAFCGYFLWSLFTTF